MIVCGALFASGMCAAAEPPGDDIPPLIAAAFKADTMAKVLPLFQSAVAPDKLPISDHVLLDVAPIAVGGTIPVRMFSELPGTDLFMLFDTAPRSGQKSLLIAQLIPSGAKPDLKSSITLDHSTSLMLVVRAADKLYAVKASVLLAEKEGKALHRK